MSADLVAVERSLWAAADQLWANTGLAPADFFTPALGLIFLRYADERYRAERKELTKGGLKPDDLDPDDYQADDVLYLPRRSCQSTTGRSRNRTRVGGNPNAAAEAVLFTVFGQWQG